MARKHYSLIAASLAAGLASPAMAQWSIPNIPIGRNETLLQVNATGQSVKPADKVDLSCWMSGSGKTVAAARQAVDGKRAALAKALAVHGVKDGDVVVKPSWQGGGLFGSLSSVAASASLGENEAPEGEKQHRASLAVALASADKISVVSDAMTDAGCGGAVEVKVGLRNPEAVREEARKAAMAKAESDAKSQADQLGMRIIRPVRVSGNMSGMMDMLGSGYKNLMSQMSNALAGQASDQPGMVVTEESVSVDYLLGPK